MTDDHLNLGVLEDGQAKLGVPAWYFNYTGNVTIRTPYGTSVIYNKSVGDFPFGSGGWLYRHYVDPKSMEYPELRNPDLYPDQMSFKPFGEEIRIYEIQIDDRRVVSAVE